MLHHDGDRRVREGNLDIAHQHQGAAFGQRARIEYAAEIFGRERRQHLGSETFKVGMAASDAGERRENGRTMVYSPNHPADTSVLPGWLAISWRKEGEVEPATGFGIDGWAYPDLARSSL